MEQKVYEKLNMINFREEQRGNFGEERKLFLGGGGRVPLTNKKILAAAEET